MIRFVRQDINLIIVYIKQLNMKRCYYDILELDSKATSSEIKTNYRKLALKFHPDKNKQDDAKQRFVQINEAYNVLSDPNERTFYDNNRQKLLFNKEEMSKQDLQQYTFGFNIWSYFTTNCFKGFEDSEGGFYSVYRNVFQLIKAEQTKAYSMRKDIEEELKKYEGFGNSETSMDRVLKFYNQWENFNTYKTFTWSQDYDTRDAGNRWVRREMQKQNKKQRQVEKKNYMKTIKDLVSYVRKRDPRFMEYLRILREQDQKKQQQRLQKEKQKKKEKQQMKIIKQKLQQERFKQIEQYYKNKEEIKEQKAHYRQQFENQDQFYCQICQKPFKSLNQLSNHEKSKQHKANLKLIQKQVMLKEQALTQVIAQLPQKDSNSQQKQPKRELIANQSLTHKEKKKKNKNKNKRQLQLQNEDIQKQHEQMKEKQKDVQIESKKQSKIRESSSDDDDAFMNALLKNRKNQKQVNKDIDNGNLKFNQTKPPPKNIKTLNKDEEQSQDEEQKIGKAKLKKMKKADQEKSKASVMNCNVCSEVFPSKTKLFQHIKKTGHASAK